MRKKAEVLVSYGVGFNPKEHPFGKSIHVVENDAALNEVKRKAGVFNDFLQVNEE